MEIEIGYIEVVDGVPQRFVPSKAFCPTGPGGGVDNSCGPKGGRGKSEVLVDWAAKEFGDETAPDGSSKAENFLKWFGGSVVTDDDGRPEVMYHHGSFDEAADTLEIGEDGMHFGTEDAARQRAYGKGADDLMSELEVSQNDDGTWGWTAGPHDSFQEFDTEDEARANAEEEISMMAENEQADADELGTFTKVYLSIQNPMVVKDQVQDWSGAIRKAKAKGHDGIVYRNEFEDKGSLSYIVFDATQVKSVENDGSFSRSHDLTKAFCPTGPGGGIDNSCSPRGGKGKVDVAAAKARYEELAAEFKNVPPGPDYSEYKHYTDEKSPLFSPLESHRAAHKNAVSHAAKQSILRRMKTERFVVEAEDPEKFRKLSDEYNDLADATKKAEHEFEWKLLEEGIARKEWWQSDGIDGIVHSQDPTVNFPGITQAHIDEAKALHQHRVRVDAELATARAAINRAYYGEKDEISHQPDTLGDVDPVVPSAVLRGKDSQPWQEARQFMVDGKLLTQVDDRILSKMATAGKMRNRFEAGAAHGVGKGNKEYNTKRKEAEEIRFGIKRDAPAEDRPIYGYIEHRDRIDSTGGAVGDNYGPIQVVLKDSVKSRSTYTIGDSLDDKQKFGSESYAVSDPAAWQPRYRYFEGHMDGRYGGRRLVEDGIYEVQTTDMRAGPTAADWSAKPPETSGQSRWVPGYIESQFHGGVSLADVEEVRVPRNIPIKPTVEKKLAKAGVKVTRIPPHIHDFYSSPKPWDEAIAAKRKGGDDVE